MKTNKAIPVPRTEGVKYAGSKLRMLPHILALAKEAGGDVICDSFSGTTRISQAFAQVGMQVISNDIAAFSGTFANCYLRNERPASFYSEIVDHLNSLEGRDGWFTENYGGIADGNGSNGTDGLKKPFQVHNTRRLDSIRDEIDLLAFGGVEESVLLSSLMLALDKVDNTIGHFASYLRQWSPRSYKDLRLKVPSLISSEKQHTVHCADVFEILDHVTADITYLDPPYGSNNDLMPASRVRYAGYYHFWNSVVLNDRPSLFGKARRRSDSSDSNASVFEDFRKGESGEYLALEALEEVIRRVRSEHLILSYSSGGRATAEAITGMLERNGRVVKVISVDHRKNVMASMRWTHKWVRDVEKPHNEFLFLLQKR